MEANSGQEDPARRSREEQRSLICRRYNVIAPCRASGQKTKASTKESLAITTLIVIMGIIVPTRTTQVTHQIKRKVNWHYNQQQKWVDIIIIGNRRLLNIKSRSAGWLIRRFFFLIMSMLWGIKTKALNVSARMHREAKFLIPATTLQQKQRGTNNKRKLYVTQTTHWMSTQAKWCWKKIELFDRVQSLIDVVFNSFFTLV